jgi:hypothetical protein
MRTLIIVDWSSSPLALEEEILRELSLTGLRLPERLRLTITGRRLIVDGFVDSVQEKYQVEKACRTLAPGRTVINRLRVATDEERQVS